MSRPRVIKNNDGVAVVQGTPAASLVKDVDKFFASKPPERMAGESIAQPQKIDPKAINTKSTGKEKKENFLDFYKKQSSPIFDGKGNVIGYKDGSKGTTEMFDKPVPREEYEGPGNIINESSKKSEEETLRYTGGSKDFNERTGRVEPGFRDKPPQRPETPAPPKRPETPAPPKRKAAKDRAEFRRRRSRMEAKRSEKERQSTRGRFISTLRR